MMNTKDIAEEIRRWAEVCDKSHLPAGMVECLGRAADTIDDLSAQVDTLQLDLNVCQAELDSLQDHQMWEDTKAMEV